MSLAFSSKQGCAWIKRLYNLSSASCIKSILWTPPCICLKSKQMVWAQSALNAGQCCCSYAFLSMLHCGWTVFIPSLQRHGSDEEAGMWWHQDELPGRATGPAGVSQTGDPHQPGVCPRLSGMSQFRPRHVTLEISFWGCEMIKCS